MVQSEHEKQFLETQATLVFAHWYSQQFNKKFEFDHLNSPAKPDASCSLDGERVDIEIAHLYGSEKEAMQILGKDLDVSTAKELAELVKTSDTQKRLLNALNRILYNKAKKHYESTRVWLVIRNAHPAWRAKHIRQHCAKIELEQNHPFEQIWIIGDWNCESGAVKIFP